MSVHKVKQEEMELWRQFKEKNSLAARQELIIRYLPQVKYHVGRIKFIYRNLLKKVIWKVMGLLG